MHPSRVRLLLSDGHSCFRPRRTGERRRKSVRGCIVGMDLSVLALSIVKQGEQEIPGLTDVVHPKRLGPKRATKIRKFFGLSKEDDVCNPISNTSNTRRLGILTLFLKRSANSLSVAKSSPRGKARNHTPKPPRSNVSSLLNAFNINATGLLSSVVVPNQPKMPRYVLAPTSSVLFRRVGGTQEVQTAYANYIYRTNMRNCSPSVSRMKRLKSRSCGNAGRVLCESRRGLGLRERMWFVVVVMLQESMESTMGRPSCNSQTSCSLV